jgi:excisionase family DNA binding protein
VPPPAAIAVISPEDLEQLVRRAVEPLRQEIAQLRAERQAEVISMAEAARRLGVSARTVQRMVARGELPSVKVGAARRVRLDGVIPEPGGTG